MPERVTNVRSTTSWIGIVPRKLRVDYSKLGLADINDLVNEWAFRANQYIKSTPWHLEAVHLRSFPVSKTAQIHCLHQLGRRLFSRTYVMMEGTTFKHYVIAPHTFIPDLSEAQLHVCLWGGAQEKPGVAFQALASLIKNAYNEEAHIYSGIREKLHEELLRRGRPVGVVAHTKEG